jgi:ABC-type sugar transport system permease subunit
MAFGKKSGRSDPVIFYKGKQIALPYLYLAPAVLLLGLLLVIPIFNVIWYSLVDNADFEQDP